MKALTICQPWAWAIMAGHKRVENRTWATRYRGELAIHAGKSRNWMSHGLREIEDVLGRQVVDQLFEPLGGQLDFGTVLGIVDLIDCIPVSQATRRFPWVADHPFADGPICWIVENPRPITEPIPAIGHQGLWNWPAPT